MALKFFLDLYAIIPKNTESAVSPASTIRNVMIFGVALKIPEKNANAIIILSI